MDYSLPGASTHGILQAGVLEWVAIRGANEVRRVKNFIRRAESLGRRKGGNTEEKTEVVSLSPLLC